MKALIDADVVLYSTGFASEDRQYEVRDSDGTVLDSFKYAAEADESIEYLKDNLEYVTELTRHKVVKPVESDLWKTQFHQLVHDIVYNSVCDDYELFMTGKDNYRDWIYPEYKANRAGSTKPIQYEEIKNWMIHEKGATVVNGREADDELGILGCNNTDTVICSVDKDLKMIPGTHYNWTKETYETVDLDGGNFWFFQQLLMGDTVDNIIGLKGVGPKKAINLLSPYYGDNKRMFQVCLDEYRKRDRTIEDVYLNATLLWIMRREGSNWAVDLSLEGMVE